MRTVPENTFIASERSFFDLDCYRTMVNNNVLVAGASGSGKTRGVVEPNILQACGSYVISDPKGNLYEKYANYLTARGYAVRKLDFTKPLESCGYNFFHYIRTYEDVFRIAHIMVYSMDDNKSKSLDPFWDRAAELLLSSIIALLMYGTKEREIKNLGGVLDLLVKARRDGDSHESKLSLLFNEMNFKSRPANAEEAEGRAYAQKLFRLANAAPTRTFESIVITLTAKLGVFSTNAIRALTSFDETHIERIGREKTALFVIISDNDRSMDPLADIFYSQAFSELARVADGLPDSHLEIPVRFILDDFATNIRIADFPRLISSFRSRWISTALMIQAEAQLSEAYGAGAGTIISNCDTYLYLGGNDIATAESIAKRCDLPLRKVLYMPPCTEWVFRRGQEPRHENVFPLEDFRQEKIAEAVRETRKRRARVGAVVRQEEQKAS